MAKKHLGQNFLKSGKALKDIVLSANISKEDIILEIGPGKGALTSEILDKAKKVIAIEKDKDLIPLLEEKFQEEIKSKKLTLLEEDVLKFDLKNLPKKYKLVANIPFYITGAILEKFLESESQPDCMSLVLQKEVAERIVARDGKESILSMSVKVFGEPKYVAKIPARYFSPEPKVDSAILLISNIKNTLKTSQKDKFFLFVKAGFAQKRKTLARNLQNMGINKEKIQEVFARENIKQDIRAEKLTLENWLFLVKNL